MHFSNRASQYGADKTQAYPCAIHPPSHLITSISKTENMALLAYTSSGPAMGHAHMFFVWSTYGTQISVMDAEHGVDLHSSLNRSATLMLISGTLKPAFFPSLSLSPTPQPWHG